ncbi:MAG TPA: carboxyl transferase [Ruminococcaceae bacterium]|nr:carboxyl transferase domain-containing protein [Oscillospiraceae bacterium]HCC02794.1 carboxyl transferase [Oscillospiraceae bacterium]HCM24881.1 carboxyl transferase [Oscillospiraceae bacterium]
MISAVRGWIPFNPIQMEAFTMSYTGAADSLENACNIISDTIGNRRLRALFDDGNFMEIDRFAKSSDHYAEAAAGYGTIEGCPVYAFAQSSDLAGGAVGREQAQKIRKVYEMAVKNGAPVIGIYDSMGGRLQEGTDLLYAYGDILRETNALSGVVPLISLVLGPCIGVSAMIASCADFVVMSGKGELTVSSDGKGGSAKEAAKQGNAAIVTETEEDAVAAVHSLIAKLPSNNLDAVGFEDENGGAGIPSAGNSAKDAAEAVANQDSLQELMPDYGVSARTALAGIGCGSAVGILAYDGILDADACSKAARFIRFCDAFNMPIVSFVNAEKFVSLRAASMLSSAYSEATCAKISVLVGNAYGPVYIATSGHGANADYTVAWPQAVISALAPETGAVFFWNDRLAGSADPIADRKKLIAQYAAEACNPMQAAAQGLIENVIQPEDTRAELVRALEMLSSKRVSTLPKKHSNIQL